MKNETKCTVFLVSVFAICVGALTLCLFGPSCAEAQTFPTVTMAWTASGDDTTSGRATSDSLRYSRNAPGADTLSWWRSAATFPVSGMPVPSVAGATDSVRVSLGSWSMTYFFLMKVCDEIPNCSGWSNVAVKVIGPQPDAIAPAAIRDLRVRAAAVSP